MKQINCRVKFPLRPSQEGGENQVQPAVKSILMVLEKIDRMIIGNFGLEMDYKCILEEMGAEELVYTIRVQPRWPGQMPLYPWPDPSALEQWMNQVRKDFFSAINTPSLQENSASLTRRWNTRALEEGLTEIFTYIPLQEERVSLLLSQLREVLTAFGSVVNLI
ncbi:MAG: hypothetical protein B0D92_03410 [Spirochaeta sp. LUC14_002_19_P3]|nr:MAG: hypothetical protein B0D92_03410 [Spirochaeta sp. LUC14_002_19_P3]